MLVLFYIFLFQINTRKSPQDFEDLDFVVASITIVKTITTISKIGHMGDTNAKNKHANTKYPICLFASIIPDTSATITPQAYDRPNNTNVAPTIRWLSPISLNGNGLKNSSPITRVTSSTIKQISNERFVFSIANIVFSLTSFVQMVIIRKNSINSIENLDFSLLINILLLVNNK